jgi:hypothetical protein
MPLSSHFFSLKGDSRPSQSRLYVTWKEPTSLCTAACRPGFVLPSCVLGQWEGPLNSSHPSLPSASIPDYLPSVSSCLSTTPP